MRGRAALALALIAAPALADDAAVVRACADRGDAAAACIGQLARACRDALPGGGTTPDISTCFARKAAAWDAALNRAWPGQMAQAKAIDPQAADALRAAQRAWIAFRDAECRAQAAHYAGGSFAQITAVACVMEQTARRVIDLARLGRG